MEGMCEEVYISFCWEHKWQDRGREGEEGRSFNKERVECLNG
jgi:hypothetical protein